MKPSDVFFYNKIEEILKTLVAHDVRVNDRFDKVDAQFKLLSHDEQKHISKELEKEIKRAMLLTKHIDQKVEDI